LGLADRVHLAGHGLDARDRRTGDVAVTLASVVLHGATAAGLRLGEALDLDVFRATLTTRYGAVAAIRIGLLVVLLVLLAAALRQAGRGAAERAGRTPRWIRVTLPPLLAGLLATVSLTGHAGTGAAAPVGLTADVLHLAAVSVWLGGLAALVTAVLPRRDPGELGQVLPRFSQLAFGAVAVVVSTGLVQTWRQVGAVDQLLWTDYGRLLLAKVTLVVLLVAAGAVSRSTVQHRLVATSALAARAEGPGAARLDPDLATVARLRRSVLVELAIAVAILALTAALVTTNPARATESTAAGSLEAVIG
jgi:copper transport protein